MSQDIDKNPIVLSFSRIKFLKCKSKYKTPNNMKDFFFLLWENCQRKFRILSVNYESDGNNISNSYKNSSLQTKVLNNESQFIFRSKKIYYTVSLSSNTMVYLISLYRFSILYLYNFIHQFYPQKCHEIMRMQKLTLCIKYDFIFNNCK